MGHEARRQQELAVFRIALAEQAGEVEYAARSSAVIVPLWCFIVSRIFCAIAPL